MHACLGENIIKKVRKMSSGRSSPWVRKVEGVIRKAHRGGFGELALVYGPGRWLHGCVFTLQ